MVTSQVTEKIDAAESLVAALETHTAKLGRGLTWNGVGRLALALVPFAVMMLAISLSFNVISHFLGFGPIADWVWGSFVHTSNVWVKLGILVAFLAALTGIGWFIKIIANWLADKYRGW